jgi:hypothetical protein
LWLIEWLHEAPRQIAALFGLVAAGGYVLTVAAVAAIGFVLWWRRTRLRRQARRFEREAMALRAAGNSSRLGMARRFQRRNVRELAATVSVQLEAVRRDIHPCLYQRATVAIEQAVKELDFNWLYALYDLFNQSGDNTIGKILEAYFEHSQASSRRHHM